MKAFYYDYIIWEDGKGTDFRPFYFKMCTTISKE